MEIDPFIFRLSIFILSIFVGYYVVWNVTPALHSPLLAVTKATVHNAIKRLGKRSGINASLNEKVKKKVGGSLGSLGWLRQPGHSLIEG